MNADSTVYVAIVWLLSVVLKVVKFSTAARFELVPKGIIPPILHAYYTPLPSGPSRVSDYNSDDPGFKSWLDPFSLPFIFQLAQ